RGPPADRELHFLLALPRALAAGPGALPLRDLHRRRVPLRRGADRALRDPGARAVRPRPRRPARLGLPRGRDPALHRHPLPAQRVGPRPRPRLPRRVLRLPAAVRGDGPRDADPGRGADGEDGARGASDLRGPRRRGRGRPAVPASGAVSGAPETGRPRVAVVIPVLNERDSLPLVVAAIPEGAADEVVVVDNGSTDGTDAVARRLPVRVVREPRRGYGRACLAGVAALEARPPGIL